MKDFVAIDFIRTHQYEKSIVRLENHQWRNSSYPAGQIKSHLFNKQ